MAPSTRVALALGSGGARGYAHIGVVQVLEERGFEIAVVAGSSMGAVVGGLLAADKLAEYTEWVLGLNQLDVVRLLDLSLAAPGAIRAEKVFARVRDLLDGALIEDLPIPFTAVATDLLARKEVWFQKGPVDVAIRSSVAIPSLITPVMLNGRLLADGGVMNPIPIAPTLAVHSDLTVAVSLAGQPRGMGSGAPASETAETRPVEEWSDRFRRGAASLLDREALRSFLGRFGAGPDDDEGEGDPAPADGPFEDLPAGLSKLDVMNRSLDAMQSVLSRYRLASYPPDLLVEVPKDACRSLDFHKAAEMIQLGRVLTVEALDRAGIAPAPALRGVDVVVEPVQEG